VPEFRANEVRVEQRAETRIRNLRDSWLVRVAPHRAAPHSRLCRSSSPSAAPASGPTPRSASLLARRRCRPQLEAASCFGFGAGPPGCSDSLPRPRRGLSPADGKAPAVGRLANFPCQPKEKRRLSAIHTAARKETVEYLPAMGFSWVGLSFSAAMLGPSLLLVPLPPIDGPDPSAAPVPRWVTVSEAIGRATCLVIPPLTRSSTPDQRLVCPYSDVLRHLVGCGRATSRGAAANALLSRPWAGIPIPLALFPVLTFAFAAAWGRSPWLAGATVVLAAGHLTGSCIRTGRAWTARGPTRRSDR
jgi:hypothetical protein